MRTIKQIQKYINKWVLLNDKGDRVVKASDDFDELIKELESEDDIRSILKVTPSDVVYSP